MGAYAWVALGSAIGGVLRYAVTLVAARLWGEAFPWGTLAINVSGSLVIGAAFAVTAGDGPTSSVAVAGGVAGENIRLFVMTGLCGGFTTFSAFSLQTLNLIQADRWPAAAAYAAASVALCVAAAAFGHWAAQRFGVGPLVRL
jgi:fluoride exporter